MKQYLPLLMVVVLFSCDYDINTTAKIANRTDIDLYHLSYHKDLGIGSQQIDTIILPSRQTVNAFFIGTEANTIPYPLYKEAYDSVIITSTTDAHIYKVYRPDDVGKNIFDVKNVGVWLYRKIADDEHEVLFEVTNDDLGL